VNPLLRSSAAHIFVPSLTSPVPEPDDAHHLFRVLRLRDGEVVTVSDGLGGWRCTEVAGTALRPTGEEVREAQAKQCTIAAAIPKGDRLEWMVQKLTEIGVSRIVLVHCARSVVRWPAERAERQLQRLGRVAREAAAQSRRTWLPVLEGPLAFATVAGIPGAVLADPDGEPLVEASVVVIGPEGGFTDEELGVGPAKVRLADTVLRVETAALLAAARVLAPI